MWTPEEISRWKRNAQSMVAAAATNDPEAFAALVAQVEWLATDGLRAAYVGLQRQGYSNADLGRALGITRQSVQQRFAKR